MKTVLKAAFIVCGLVIGWSLGGCAAPKAYAPAPSSSYGAAASDKEGTCNSLVSKQRTWAAVAAVAGVLGGGGGLTAVLMDNGTSGEERKVIGGAALGVAAGSALAVYLSDAYARDFRDRRCAEVIAQ